MTEQGAPRSLHEWLDYIDRIHPRHVDMGLDRVRTVADRLGVRAPAPVSVIVAGTNGKGSTCIALETLLLAAGLRVGTTLSPHVERFNERVRLNGTEAQDATLIDALARVDAARDGVTLTYFEFAALAALHLFRCSAVDVAVLEVGLGGRLDAFNLVDADLAIVTSIGLDHQDYLGSDVESIGREKAGVFRPGQKVVLGRVSDSVHEAAAALGCPTLSLDREIRITESGCEWSCACAALALYQPRLEAGALAPSNCALALTAAAWLTGRTDLDARALTPVAMPGRMERHLLDGVEVILDVAHNPAGAAFLAGTLERTDPARRYVAVLGMLADKDAVGVVGAMASRVRHWLMVPTPGPRGQTADHLARRLGPGARPVASMAEALPLAVSLTEPGDGILAFGSFSAVEQARALLIHPSRHD